MNLKRRCFFLGYAILFLVWIGLYLPHLRTSPGWYSDETLIHHTSLDLTHGIASNFALWNTFWHPHYPYQPVYTFFNGLFGRLAGGDIYGARFFNTLLALSAAILLYRNGSRIFGFRAAFFAALMFLCYDQTIIHYRMSYAHNWVGLGLLIVTLFLLRKPTVLNDWKAGLGLLMAAGGHPLFVHGAIASVLGRIRHPSSWIRLAIPCTIYLIVSMSVIYIFFGQWLIEDLQHLKNVFTQRGFQDGEGFQGVINFTNFLLQDWFHSFVFIGLLLCLPLRKWAAPIMGFFVLFMLVRNRSNLIEYYYQAVIILPTLCLGWAGLWRLLEKITRRHAPRLGKLVYLFALFPLVLMAFNLPVSWNGHWIPRNFFLVTQDTKEVEEAAAWINRHTDATDVVGGNPNIAWLLDAQTVPYLQMITWYGIPTQGYENGNRKERFRYDASLNNAKYAIIGDIDSRWALLEPNVPLLREKMSRDGWKIVWRGKYYAILANPGVK